MSAVLARASLLAVAAALAGCAGTAGPPQTPAVSARTSGHTSWMAGNVTAKNLLYVSDYDAVLVYDYGTTTQVGKLDDFSEAEGACNDARGDVFITNFGAADVLEFAHGGTQPIATLIDPSPYPTDCAVDAAGDVAVINEYGASEDSAGNVAVFTGGKGKPAVYKSKAISTFVSGTYDDRGDLLVSGYESSALSFAMLNEGGKALEPVTLAHSDQWSYPGYVRWDGEYFDVEYQVPYYQYPAIFMWYTIKGTTGTQEGYMLTGESGEGSGPFWLGRIGGSKSVKRANQLVAAIRDEGVLIWNYPRGGSYIFDLYGYQGSGVTASPAQR